MSTHDALLPFYGASQQQPARPSVRADFNPPAHHNAPPGTSEVAARSVRGFTGAQRARVLAFIASRGPHGATDDEGESALGIKPQTYTPRRGELVKAGFVVDSGVRRPTASGRPAAVWIVRRHAEGRAQ